MAGSADAVLGQGAQTGFPQAGDDPIVAGGGALTQGRVVNVFAGHASQLKDFPRRTTELVGTGSRPRQLVLEELRCCFTIALQTARDQVVQAAAVITDPADAGRVGQIGHRILARLLPPRRQRVSTRKVKSLMSRYSTRHDDGRPDTSRTVTGLDTSVLEPREPHPQLPVISRDDRNTALADRRRHRILGLLEEDSTRLWRPRDIASHFGDITMETMYRQLSRWAETGLIHKLGPGLYAATAWTPTPLA
ncbi:hypothetical protein ACH4LT_21100 [Streptomyces clavifer]|uniref:hypothetical protein n=1 Tax=Streptomyces clavifer TaxID=68188 RepID=UPI0037AAC71B